MRTFASITQSSQSSFSLLFQQETLKLTNKIEMKVAICLVGFVAVSVVSANYLPAAPLAAGPAAINTGSSQQYRSQDNLGQYSFGYDEAGATGGSFRHEKSDAYGNKYGSYGLRGADGKVRVVNYVADANGFRANVQTNEPGTEPRNPAGVQMNHPVPVAVAAAPVAVPIAAPVHYPAPVAAAPLPLPLPVPVAHAPLAVAAAPLLPALAPPAIFGYGLVNHHFAPALPAY